MRNISRRDAIKSILAGGAMVSAAPLVSAGNLLGNPSVASEPLKGNIHHSVSNGALEIFRWMSSVRFANASVLSRWNYWIRWIGRR